MAGKKYTYGIFRAERFFGEGNFELGWQNETPTENDIFTAATSGFVAIDDMIVIEKNGKELYRVLVCDVRAYHGQI